MVKFAMNSTASATMGFVPFKLNGTLPQMMSTPVEHGQLPGVRLFVERIKENLLQAHDADEPLLRLIGKQAIFAISELNSSAMAWSIDTILFAICSIYSLLRSRRVSLRSSDSFNGDLRSKSFYTLSTSSLHILVISSSIPSILSLSCLRISILRFNTFPGASRAILTFHFQYLLYFTL